MTMRVRAGSGQDAARRHDDPAQDFVEIEVESPDGRVTVIRRVADRIISPPATRPVRPQVVLQVGEPLTDGIVAALAFAVGDVFDRSAVPAEQALWGVVLAATWVALLGVFGRYDLRRTSSTDALLRAAGIVVPTVTVLGAMIDSADLATSVVIAFGALAVGEALATVAWSRFRRRGRAEGWLCLRTAVVAGDGDAERLVTTLAATDGDMLPVVRVDATAAEGVVAAVTDALAAGGVDCVLVAAGSVPSGELDALRRTARQHGAELRVTASVPTALPSDLRVRGVGGHAVVSVPRARLDGLSATAKRAMDLVLGTVAFVLALPVMVVIAVAIKATSRGPVFFRQPRVTKGGRTFRIVKFRTMSHVQEHPGKLADVTQPFFKLQDDPRLTKVGRMIRPLSLDELPQLWNVLAGDMSRVGPRPLPAEQVAAHPEPLGRRHEVRAGMTGWWQVNGRSDVPAEEAVAYDQFYIENWSLGLDLRIVGKTIGVLLRRRGAY